jgi:hypothetical protein
MFESMTGAVKDSSCAMAHYLLAATSVRSTHKHLYSTGIFVPVFNFPKCQIKLDDDPDGLLGCGRGFVTISVRFVGNSNGIVCFNVLKKFFNDFGNAV